MTLAAVVGREPMGDTMSHERRDAALFASLQELETRSFDGSGNNPHKPDWGATDEPLIRVNNSFPDGEGNDLEALRDDPAPEAITETVMNADNGGVEGAEPISVSNSFGVNEYAQFFGQFIAHDLVFSSGGDEEEDGELSGITRNDGATIDGVRQQINEETAYLDLGQVYDNDPDRAELLREPDSGRMLTDDAGMLPSSDDIAHAHDVEVGEEEVIEESPVVTGDFRAAQTDQLLSHHTVWLKNHNYHADRLAEQFPDWSRDQVFEAARALNEAEYQWVVYNEYLPAIIGERNVADYDGYDGDVNAGILNDFTTGVFRFGHDQANNFFDLLEEDGSVAADGPGENGTGADVTLFDSFIPLSGEDAGIAAGDTPEKQADWIRGQLGIPTQEIDGFVVSGNRGGVLGIPGRNLEAFDIVRGREHGVGNYNAFRESHGLEAYETWDDFFHANDVGEVRRGHLRELYGSKPGDIDNLDTIIGALLEAEEDGSQLGPTATTVIREQFANLRDGDRFYFENRFTPEQVEEIESTSLADIVERTSEVEHVYRDALIAAPRIGGGDRDDDLEGTEDGDLVIGFDGDDRLDAGAGHDDVYGGAGRDLLRGGAGADLLDGEDGRDTLSGGGGTDAMVGGRDADTFVYGGGDDVILDFEMGLDTILIGEEFAGREHHLTHREDFRALVEDSSVGLGEEYHSTLDFGDGDRLTLLGVDESFI